MNVTFAPGQTTATITIRPVDDTTVENRESVILYMNPSTMYRLGANSAARIDITDNDVAAPTVTPLITVAATDADAGEAGTNPGTFTLTRTGALNNTLTVRYTASGTATGGFDLAALSGFAYFQWGQATTTVTITPYNDPTFEPVETVIVNLTDGAAYDLGATASATVNMTSDDAAPVLPTVTIVATDANAAERNRDSATFTVTRTGSTAVALLVNYAVTGSATRGRDYDALSGSVVIPAGQSSATVTVRPIDDTAIEANETVVLTLANAAAYQRGSAVVATATIVSDDGASVTPTVTISAVDANAAERNRDVAMFRVSRTGATATALTVRYSVGGTSTNGVDYSQLSGSIVIPVGASFVTVTVMPTDDTVVEPNESVVLTLGGNAAYLLGAATTATATIVSDDVAPVLPTVSITATDSTAAEANRETGTFTVSRTGSTTAALVVNYSLSGTATNRADYDSLSGTVTIPAGQSSATITVRPVDDTTVDANETVTVTLAANAAYNRGTLGGVSVAIADNDVPTQQPLPVLLVIPNNDFYYQEYADPRSQLLAAGIPVVVAAGRRELSTPHPNSGQGSASGQVMPDIALADANVTNYSAIVFVGGWGASQYQYAFSGTYNNSAYNGTTAIRERVNQLINDFVAQNKYVTALCHGVSVLAWARVNGQSLLQGRNVSTYDGASPPSNISAAQLSRWHAQVNGATVFTGGVIGNTGTRADDVIVDGRIITGENFDSARQFGITLANQLRSTAGSATN
jgi:putative intracellular protease/amidase/inorganic pyrophosphatase